MKKLRFALILALAFAMLLLCACGGGSGSTTDNGTHTQCVDNDGDGKCDECNKDMNPDKEPDEPDLPDEPCDKCIDDNGDGKCDKCGEEVECGSDCECLDEDFDGICDICSEKMEGAIKFAENGKTEFAFVLGDGLSGNNKKAVDALAKELKGLGVTVEKLNDSSSTVTEYEILFGNVKTRGAEYILDSHDYGVEGYAIKVIGNKIAVVGGSDASLGEAIARLRAEILGIEDGMKTYGARYIYESQSISEIQDNYRITSISINGEDIKGYTLAIDKDHIPSVRAANAVQTLFYETAGYWLPIVDISEADNSIIIELVPKTGDVGFYVNVNGSELRVSCEFESNFQAEMTSYFERKIKIARGDIDFTSSNNEKINIRDVYYSKFGAVGDGVTDDFEAICAAHEYASEEGYVVYANPGATYYIGSGHFKSAMIKTDTVFGDATFIIDDSGIGPYSKKEINGENVYEREIPIFNIAPSIPETIVRGSVTGLSKDATNIGFAPRYQAVVVILDTSKRQYIRYGANKDSGQFQCETVLVDKDGNIIGDTNLMWDFENVSYCRVYYADDKPITVSGGHFITKYNQAPSDYTPYYRGIYVSRSNVTIKDMTHRYTDYGETGGPSAGIVRVENCYNTVIDNVEVENPKMFYELGNDGVTLVGMGSYEFSARWAVNVTWQNCTQINFYGDDGYAKAQGMHGTNHCKNMFYINNRLSSFDSHTGAQNITIKGCEIEHINCIGAGKVIIEDTIIHAMHQNCAIILRGDYGSLWMGDVYFKNVTLITKNKTYVALMQASWPGPDHNFGFKCTMPTNVYVDNITIDSEIGLNKILLTNGTSQLNAKWEYWKDVVINPSTGQEVENKNPYSLVEKLYIKNCKGYTFSFPAEFTTEIIYQD